VPLPDINCANQVILEIEWLAPGDPDNALLYEVDVNTTDSHLHRSLVRDTRDHVVLNRTANEEVFISVRTGDRCGRMSSGTVESLVVQGKAVLSIAAVDNV